MNFHRAELITAACMFATVLGCCFLQLFVVGQTSPITWAIPFFAAAASLIFSKMFITSKFQAYLKLKASGQEQVIAQQKKKDHQLEVWDQLYEQGVESRLQPVTKMLTVARADIADMALKETESRVPKRIEEEIKELTSTQSILDKVVHRISDELREFVLSAAGFQPSPQDDNLCHVSSWGLSEGALEKLNAWILGFLAQSIASGDVVVCTDDKRPLVEIGFGGADGVLVAPLIFSDRFLGVIIVGVRGSSETITKLKRTMRTLATVISAAMYRASVAEDIIEAQRRDKLTGCLNRFALEETLSSLDHGSNVSLILVEGNSFVQFNESIGRAAADELVKALASTLRLPAKADEQQAWFRIGAAQFVLLVENIDNANLLKLSERIKTAVDRRTEWPRDVNNWTVSIAIVEPGLGVIGKNLLVAGEETILYMRQHGLNNRILPASQVPKAFKAKKTTTIGIAGSLPSLQPANVLRSISLSGSTGILRITHPERTEFWAFYQEGQLFKARMGKLHGDFAVIELLSLYDDGEFKFTEQHPDALINTGDDVSKLGKSYSVTDLTLLIQEGVAAQNRLCAARSLIPKANLYARVVDGSNSAQHWEDIRTIKSPPSDDEIRLMVQILRHANGQVKLNEIFALLDAFPTAHLWHSAALLLEHNFMKLSALKVYAMPGHI
jgi:diguanylate cyclase (GGDEF)-like protein